jgi:uncharacterized GH25 family protein
VARPLPIANLDVETQMKINSVAHAVHTRLAVLALLLVVPAAASAHQIWIEQDKSGAKLYFGEFAENVRESSPGYLDKFPGPTAMHLSGKGEEKLSLSKTAAAFVMPARVRKGESVIAEEANYPVLERKEGEKTTRTFWTPAARYVADFTAQPPKLTLDIVPTGKPGEVQVVYRGQPMPKAEIGIVAASGWSLDKQTDEQGKVSFPLPWKGSYLVKVRHVENVSGKRPGRSGQPEVKYDAASFATTLSFVTPTGLPSPPAPMPPPRPSK